MYVFLMAMLLTLPTFANSILISSTPGLTKAERKGEYTCKELKFPIKKYVCNYIPLYESARAINESILRQFSGSKQFGNPDSAYSKVVGNGQVEFANEDENFVKEILNQIINDYDTLESYVERREVNLDIRAYEVTKNAGDSFDFMIKNATVVGKGGTPMTPGNRFMLSDIGGVVAPQLAMGNLVTSLLTAALGTLESKGDIDSMTAAVQKGYTNGSFLQDRRPPVSQMIHITPNTVTTVPEQALVQFEGEVKFLKGIDNKIKISKFAVKVANAPKTAKTDGFTPGVLTFNYGPVDLYFDVGCAQVLTVTVNGEKTKKIEKRLGGLLGTSEVESVAKKQFMFVVQVLDPEPRQPGEYAQCNFSVPAIVPTVPKVE